MKTKKILFPIIFLFCFITVLSLIWFFGLKEKFPYSKESEELPEELKGKKELEKEVVPPLTEEVPEKRPNENNSKTDYPVIIENKALPISSFRHLDTKDWLTFTSERCKFSVKYPPDWKVEEKDIISSYCTREQANPIGRTIEECKEALSKDPEWERRRFEYYIFNLHLLPDSSAVRLKISFHENPKRTNINNWINQKLSSSSTCFPIVSDNIEGLACADTSEIETEEKPLPLLQKEKFYAIYNFYLSYEDMIYVFSASDVYPTKEAKQVYETIFSTFTIQE